MTAGCALAGALAPELDRVALCIHRPTGHRPDLMATLSPLGLPPRSFVVVAARPLAAGRLSFADVCVLSRYAPPEDLARGVDAHVRRGLLVETGSDGAYAPSDGFRDGAAAVLRMQAEEAERLWGPAGVSVADAGDLAAAHVAAAAAASAGGEGDDLPAFGLHTATDHVVPPTPAGRLLGHVTALRYLRADVHAAALAGHGLPPGPAARALHRLWRGFEADSGADELEARGLARAEGQGWTATAAGRALCEAVEVETDERFAAVVGAVDTRRSEALLTALRRLPGDDPRPPEDR